jgi:hypothetical protein
VLQLPSPTFITLLKPYLNALANSQDKPLVNRLRDRVFRDIVIKWTPQEDEAEQDQEQAEPKEKHFLLDLAAISTELFAVASSKFVLEVQRFDLLQ